MSLTKDEIIGSLQSGLGLSRSESSLAGGDDVLISRFGVFMVRQKSARRGRNPPATGEDLPLAPRKVVNFRCAPALRARIDGIPTQRE